MFLLMQAKKLKTVRFKQLVGESGEPKQVILWSEPEQDRKFMKAVTENRVATVVQRNVGTKKDYGLVGFVSQPKAAFIAFPKQLGYPAGTKIVGIDYDSIKQPEAEGPLYTPTSAKTPSTAKREAAKKSHAASTVRKAAYEAKVRITATGLVSVKVEAKSKAEAVRLIRAQAQEVNLNLQQAKVTRTITGLKKKG